MIFWFFKANLSECAAVQDVLSMYKESSGQEVNFTKSSIIFSANVTMETRQELRTLLSVTESDGKCKYLGMPLQVGQKKVEAFQFLKYKLWQRIAGWRDKKLSRAGKEVLLKTVAQALPTYVMSLYQIPKEVCVNLHRLMNSFWWTGSQDRKGIKWQRWERLCVRKELGGIGFKDLQQFNLAMLAKQGWRIFTNPNCLMVRLLKAKYFRVRDFWEAREGGNPSSIWKNILTGRDVLKQGVRRRIGDGQGTWVCRMPWFPDRVNGFVTTEAAEGMPELKVSDLMIPGSQVWDSCKVTELFNARDRELILSIPLSHRTIVDE